MNYQRVYNNIISNARGVLREGYLESHHIIPKCLGGSNDKENLVLLTAREHYICHLLLAKIHNTKQLWYAFAMMTVSSPKHRRDVTSRMFEQAKLARSKANSGENNPMFGKPSAFKVHTPETREKIRQSKLGKRRSAFTRTSPDEETRKKISESNKGKIAWNKGKPAERWVCPNCLKEGGGASNRIKHVKLCTQEA
jgi:hypothetical protein